MLPLRKARGPVMPACAMSAETMPLRVPMPACTRLTEPPVEVYSVVPAAWLSAMESACRVVSASNLRNLAETAAAPKLDSTACG
ncbi:hypothetical protein D9M70_491000 [compost metagenome]